MLVSDIDCSFGSPIRVRVRLGGLWKAKGHSLYTSVCMTDEHDTSQSCVFVKGGKEDLKVINGTSVCSNKTCIRHLAKQSRTPKDSLCVLAIGVSGASKLIQGRILSVCMPSL
ncbi:hypothetical protein EDC96DRAFT_450154 [Choanephora cucurbitarum]|nr:hypothetical protein EDC96DRAFT_450154 [Choanephora cucurbitarum]